MDLVTVPAGQIAYIYARDGKNLPGDQILGEEIDCNAYEDVIAFLNNGGQRGPQRAILNAGTYAINLAQFVVLCDDGIHAMSLKTDNERIIIEDIDQTIRSRDGYRPVIISGDNCGIVTVHDGPSLEAGELVAQRVMGHNSFQKPQDFLNNGGCKGIQLDPITNGTYYINRLFATVEVIPKKEIPIGMVGVVNYFTGDEGEDLSGIEYNHGELVENGKKGVWIRPLEPNKYAWNPYAGTVYEVPTTNFVLKWQNGAHNDLHYDDLLEEISLITKDAFQPSLPLSVVIHIDYTDASKVIQRFGDIKTLISETIDPMVGAYFKNIGQTRTLLELIQDRSKIQLAAKDEMQSKFSEYNLNLVEVLIGTPKAEENDEGINEILQSIKDRQKAKEKTTTLAEQTREEERRSFEQAKQTADMQGKLTASAMQVEIADNDGKATVAKAIQEARVLETEAQAQATKKTIEAGAEATAMMKLADAKKYQLTAEAEGKATQISEMGRAQADSTARNGVAAGIATHEQVTAVGQANQTRIKIAEAFAGAIGSYGGDLVPKSVINMSADENAGMNGGNIFSLLLLKILNPDAFEQLQIEESRISEETQKIADMLREQILASATSVEGDNTPVQDMTADVSEELSSTEEVGEADSTEEVGEVDTTEKVGEELK